jgi:D-alanine-D-alanine ligase
MRRQGHSVAFSPVVDSDLPRALAAFDPADTIVFNWCEALPGLDRSEAHVVRILDALRFTYTGAPAKTIELSYDKARVKRLLEAEGIPTPCWQVFASTDVTAWTCFPAIVKPAYEHCSHGVDSGSVVADNGELRARVARILERFRQPALVEDFIDGREFHVPVWGNGRLDMLPPVEMDFTRLDNPRDRVCTYDAKFTPDSDAYRRIGTRVPAPLSEEEAAALKAVSTAAYRTVGCRDYGRIDVRLRDGVFYVLDVNPNADITIDASIAVAAQKAGYCYGAVGARVLELAAARHPSQNLAPHQ